MNIFDILRVKEIISNLSQKIGGTEVEETTIWYGDLVDIYILP